MVRAAPVVCRVGFGWDADLAGQMRHDGSRHLVLAGGKTAFVAEEGEQASAWPRRAGRSDEYTSNSSVTRTNQRARNADARSVSTAAQSRVSRAAAKAGRIATTAILTALRSKLVHNCAGYMIQCALAEAFTMGVKAGVEPLALWQAVRQGAVGRSRTFDRLPDHFLSGKFDPPDFALRLAHKDVSLATALAREHHVPMHAANLALDELTEALNRGWGSRDSRVAMLLQEERAGVEIKVEDARLRAAQQVQLA